CNLSLRGLGLEPLGKGNEIVLGNGAAVLVAQEIFKQNLHREGQAGNPFEAVFLCGRKAVIDVGLGADLEGAGAFETVERGHLLGSIPAGGKTAWGGGGPGEVVSGE